MLGLITSLSQVIHTHDDSRVHRHHQNVVGSGETIHYLSKQDIKDEKISSLKELKFKSAYEVNLMKIDQKYFTLPLIPQPKSLVIIK